jgi:hypothetical protein
MTTSSSGTSSSKTNADSRAHSGVKDSKGPPDGGSKSVQTCEHPYLKWLHLTEPQRAELAKADPFTYVLMRAIDLRLEFEKAHSFGACYSIAIVKKGNLTEIWVSGVTGSPPPQWALKGSEVPIRIRTEKVEEQNKHHAEIILLDKAEREGYEVVSIAATRAPCDPCKATYVDRFDNLDVVPTENREDKEWQHLCVTALDLVSIAGIS